MFKFRRSSRRGSNPIDDDDDEPMMGKSYKNNSNGRNRQQQQQQQQHQQQLPLPNFDRTNSGGNLQQQQLPQNPMRNYSANTTNKHGSRSQLQLQLQQQQQQHASSKVSWVSDTCSETDVTETWTTGTDQFSFGSQEGSEGSASDGQGSSSEAGASGDYSNESSNFSSSRDASSSGWTEHEEDSRSSQESGQSRPESEDGGGSFNSQEDQARKLASGMNPLASRPKYFTDEEASYSSVGDHIVVKRRGKAKVKPPPPPRRSSTGMNVMNNESFMSSGEGSVKSNKSQKSNKSNISNGNGSNGSGEGVRHIRGGDKGSKSKSSKSSSSKSSSRRGSVEEGNKSSAASVKSPGGSTTTPVNTPNTPPPPTKQDSSLEEMKLKPPSMKGMNNAKLNLRNFNQRQRSNSSSDLQSCASTPTILHAQLGVPSSGSTVASSSSEGKAADGTAHTEVAAMQQLAYLVVSLRSDLREANLARDELETKVDKLELEKANNSLPSDANPNKSPYGDDNEVRQLEKENADLQADVDAFIDEQDELKNEIKQLTEDKSSLNDMISRLKKKDSFHERTSANAFPSSSSNKSSSSTHEELQARVAELTDENHKLEREIQMLVGEKSQLVSSGDSRSCEIEELHKFLKESEMRVGEKERAMQGMQETIDSLENSVEELGKDLKETGMSVMILEDELEKKEREVVKVQTELNSEGTKMTLVRQRLAQVEKQKGEMTERNTALDGVMLALKKKVEDLIKERNSSRKEIENLKKENVRIHDEVKLKSSKAIAKEANDSDTLLNLQKMIASLEETKEQLEEELDHKDAEVKLDTARIIQLDDQLHAQQDVNSKLKTDYEQQVSQLKAEIKAQQSRASQLESKFKVQEELNEMNSRTSEGDDEKEEEIAYLKEHITDLTLERGDIESKLRETELEKACIEDDLEDLKLSNEKVVKELEEELEAHKFEISETAMTVQDLEDELEETAENIKELQEKLADRQEIEASLNELETSKLKAESLESQNEISQDTISNLQTMISQLEETKNDLEDEMNEATDAIAMLEDELDSKDAQVKEFLVKLTMLQQQFSQAEKGKTALAERNARLTSENDDFNTEIKVLIIEKKVATEELDTLKALKSIEDEDKEEAHFRNEETRQEVDDLIDKLEQVRANSQEKILKLEQKVYKLVQSKCKLEEDLDESSDAIAVLREALTEQEERKARHDAELKKYKSALAEKDKIVTVSEASHSQLQSEHQVSVDTISTLQKMISSLESSKEDLEEELDISSAALVDLKNQLKTKNTRMEITELENALKQAERDLTKANDLNERLQERIEDLQEMNDTMNDQVKALGESLAHVSATNRALAILPSSASGSNAGAANTASASASAANSSAAKSHVSDDPVASCDALISELKSQINEIVSARNAALEEVEYLRSDGASFVSSEESHTTIPPPAPQSGMEKKPVAAAVAAVENHKNISSRSVAGKSVASKSVVSKSVASKSLRKSTSSKSFASKSRSPSPSFPIKSRSPSPSPLDDSAKSEPSEEDSPSTKTMEKSSTGVQSSAVSHAGSRGSSLLEAAKKLCNQLDEKRSKEESDKINSAVSAAAAVAQKKEEFKPLPREVLSSEVLQREDEVRDNVLDIDDNVSAKEVKEDAAPLNEAIEEAKHRSQSPDEEKKEDFDKNKPARKGKFDIDQLTSIYFEKCGMSVSRFSDLSSDSSSFRRRVNRESRRGDTVTKKVKICRNGVFMGTYEGDLNTEGQRHGFGVLLCDNGNSYEGEWKKDKRDGLGIARYSSGDVYDGQWSKGKRQGHGVMYIEAGDTYIGSWDNGLKHGAGTYHWADGEVDVSWYQEDRRVGEGVRWNAGRSKAYRLIRGTKKEELSLDEAYVTAEKLGLNLEKFDSGIP